MNCPNCGSPISGLRCSICSFDLKQHGLYYIGASASKQISALSRYIREKEAPAAPDPEVKKKEEVDPKIIETVGTAEIPTVIEKKSSAFPNIVMVTGFLAALAARLHSKPSRSRPVPVIASNMITDVIAERKNHAKRVSRALKITCLLLLILMIPILLLQSGVVSNRYVPYLAGVCVAIYVAVYGIFDIYAKMLEWRDVDGEIYTNVCFMSNLIFWLAVFITGMCLLAYWIFGMIGWSSGRLFLDQVRPYAYPFFIFIIFAHPIVNYLEYARIQKKYNYIKLHYILWGIISMGLCILLAVLLLPGPNRCISTWLSTLPFPGETEAPAALKAGDTISLGRYEQNGNLEDGAEELSWLVQSVSDGRAFVLCRPCIDAMPYHEDGTSSLWAYSTIRSWLNRDFINSAFSDQERSIICESQLTTPFTYIDEEGLVRRKDADGETTTDRIFLPEMSDFRRRPEDLNVSEYAGGRLSDLCPYDKDDQHAAEWLESRTAFWIRNSLDENRNFAWNYSFEENRGICHIGPPNIGALVRPCMYIDVDAYLGLAEKEPAPSPAGGSTAEDPQTKYYTDCLDELNAGLSAGAYKQVLYAESCIYCLNADGTVTVLGSRGLGEAANGAAAAQDDYSSWSDIASISVLYDGSLVGVRTDGTVLANGRTFQGEVDVSGWSNIVSVSASNSEILLGLQEDGTVLFTPTELRFDESGHFAAQLSRLNGCVKIDSVETKNVSIIGLTPAGTIATTYDGASLYYHGEWGQEYKKWSKLQDISVLHSPGANDVFGLTDGGKVVCMGSFSQGWSDEDLFSASLENEVSPWDDVIAISTGDRHLVALRSDGTVLAAGDNSYGQCDVGDWTDIVRIEAYYNATVGYAADGSIKAAGYNSLEQQLSNLQEQ